MSGPGRILALWAVPRSTSTAFERMMRQRGDHECLHEPFGEVWYSGDDARCPPAHLRERRPGLTYSSVWQRLLALVDTGPVFVKEFAHHVSHLIDDEFLDHFTHSFLIREPEKVLPSLYDHWPDFTLEEAGFEDQRRLFDRLADRQGPPPVIDAEELLDDPHGVVEAWCAAVGIEFVPGALTWEPADRRDLTWYDGGSWHEQLERSTGLGRKPREYVPIEHDPHLVRAHAVCRPHYEHLRQYRLGTGS